MERKFRRGICSYRCTVRIFLQIAQVCPIVTPPSTILFSSVMPSSKRPSVPIAQPHPKQHRCSACGVLGHNKRKCPAVPPVPAILAVTNGPGDNNGVTEDVSPPPSVPTATQEPSPVDWEKMLYVVFDLETTGIRKNRDDIIELAAVILDQNGIQIEDASFVQFVRPRTPIPPFVTALTSITNDDVSSAESFSEVGGAFIRFMQQHADDHDTSINHIVLVGHNGKVFDIPFFVQQLHIHKIDGVFFSDKRFGLGLDSMRIAKESVKKRASVDVPTAYNLKTLFQFVTGKSMEVSHRALEDVKATVAVLRHEAFWTHRKDQLFRISALFEDVTAAVVCAETVGDHDDSGDDGSVSSSSSEDNDEGTDSTSSLGNRWKEGVDFTPGLPGPMQRFQEYCTVDCRSRRQRCSNCLCATSGFLHGQVYIQQQ
jgi:DNA polymerase III epsilon subunit-like protein